MDAALEKYPQLDGKRLGWWGWSWGGTFTLYAMTHSDRIRAGVAVAPVTDWHNYDSIYTERYMSGPADFAEGYKDFSVVNSAANLKGRLLLVHGTGDDPRAKAGADQRERPRRLAMHDATCAAPSR